jgi:hypothetical protein
VRRPDALNVRRTSSSYLVSKRQRTLLLQTTGRRRPFSDRRHSWAGVRRVVVASRRMLRAPVRVLASLPLAAAQGQRSGRPVVPLSACHSGLAWWSTRAIPVVLERHARASARSLASASRRVGRPRRGVAVSGRSPPGPVFIPRQSDGAWSSDGRSSLLRHRAGLRAGRQLLRTLVQQRPASQAKARSDPCRWQGRAYACSGGTGIGVGSAHEPWRRTRGFDERFVVADLY